MSIAERLITTPVNQHAVPALRPCSVIVSWVCVSRACEGGLFFAYLETRWQALSWVVPII